MADPTPLLGSARPVLVLIIGPIAGGKSALAAALTDQLRQDGRQVALVGLDEIAAMALPTLPDWQDAHTIHASVVGQWLRTSLDVVVAEGPESREQVQLVLDQVPAQTQVLKVIVTIDHEIALARAQADPTRGISKQPEFLSRVHREWQAEWPLIECDVIIDTGLTALADSVAAVLGRFPPAVNSATPEH